MGISFNKQRASQRYWQDVLKLTPIAIYMLHRKNINTYLLIIAVSTTVAGTAIMAEGAVGFVAAVEGTSLTIGGILTACLFLPENGVRCGAKPGNEPFCYRCVFIHS